ncbi:hypothetical protein Poly30_09140 [Planctomycetes bacterium Poly30]|uniref:Uncharacterized protein n=1 Tax=Saltatorellus ferox TaxID=2528018 RepID=A0A518EMU9_9BACT|nr:hypothetical protein Poly30_09140 [Planctomycetes bacterium Poly30]
MKNSAFLTLCSVAFATHAAASDIDAWTQTTTSGMEIRIDVSGQPNAPFAIWSGSTMDAPVDLSTSVPIGRGIMNGVGQASLVLPVPASMPANFGVELYVLTREPNGFSSTGTWVPLQGNGGTLCQTFDPNYKLGVADPQTGEFMSDQWSEISMTIAGLGNNGRPDEVIVFDSANPTGNDTDLITPGYGANNTTGLGKVLILPTDITDGNSDGLVDVPDDSIDGGVMRFDFSEPYRMCSATVLDIDDNQLSELRFYVGAAMTLETIPLMNLGDNSIQTLTFDKRDVRRFEVAFGGSGALARLGMVPCPLNINLDETPFGGPRAEQMGTVITNQYLDLGVSISANNNVAGHPNKVVLFDSENPTGGDFDLMTPGPGIGNTEALGLVLIIAENDVDANSDGLIDSPDDEAGGGQMLFEFTEDIIVFNAKVLDVDGLERDVFTFFDEFGAVVDILEINALGDNSVQTLSPVAPIGAVRSIQVNFVGSGALARLRWCPSSNF